MPSPKQGSDPDAPTDAPSRPAVPLQPSQPTQPLPSSPASPSTSLRPGVSNTTPLITLGEIGLLDVLRQLYETIWIPPAVLAEYQHGRVAHPQRPDPRGVSWVTVRPAPVEPLVPASLDAGERDATALARAQRASRILLDDRAARAVATRLNLAVTGSAGVLLAAKQLGFISLIKPYLDLMVAQGRHIGPSVYEQVVRQAGE